MRGNSKSKFVPVKNRNGATISDKERVKERGEHFDNVLNHGRITGKGIEKNEKVCDTLDVKEDIFFEEGIVTVLNGSNIKYYLNIKNIKIPDADTVVNEFLKYGGYGGSR